MRTLKANVWVYSGTIRRLIEVQVQAHNFMDAKSIVEAQFGSGNVPHPPRPC
jgi:hypothetical protein